MLTLLSQSDRLADYRGFLFARKQDVNWNIVLIADLFWRWSHVEPHSPEHISSGFFVIQKLNWPRYLQTSWRKNNTDNAGVSIGVGEVSFCLHRNKSPENLVAVRVFIIFVTTFAIIRIALVSID